MQPCKCVSPEEVLGKGDLLYRIPFIYVTDYLVYLFELENYTFGH